MSFLGKLFGSKAPSPAATLVPSSVDPATDPNMIRVFDSYGQEMFITKQAWRDSVLLGHIKKVWNDPEALYAVIAQSLQDGFVADMVEPAEHLASIDPDAERAAVVLANIYRDQNRRNDSETVLRRHIERHGESGLILTNLAKVQSDSAEQLHTLWHALELDPNQENAVSWYEVIHREKDGSTAGLDALRRIAALPGSWRARLWLARASLEAHDLPAAFTLYREALALADKPTPADLLMQLSGDLGKAAYLSELLELTTPQFDVATHGLLVGNNLIKALLDLGRFGPARKLVQQLYAQNRPDWKQTLSFWDTEIAKAQAAATPVDAQEPLSATLLSIHGPIWLPEQSLAHELFPLPTGAPVHIAFLGGTAETGAKGDKPIHQITDGPGRLSRALPLFLAEQARFGARVSAHTLQMWLNVPHSGFVLSGMPWTDEDASTHARQNQPVCEYVAITHLKAFTEPWQVELRLVRTIDGKCLATSHATFPSNQAQASLPALAKEMLQFLEREAQVALIPEAAHYQVPTGGDFTLYLVRLEQLLAVRSSNREGTSSDFLSGERDIIDGNVQLCFSQPKNPTVRILLLQTCLSMKRIRPAIVAEYREKLERLHREHPFTEPVHGITQRLLASVVAP